MGSRTASKGAKTTEVTNSFKPAIPRLHLFEIDDQPWFPAFLRRYVQMGLLHLWTTKVPIIQECTPASLVAQVLQNELGQDVSKHTFVDFCSGAGGPTPEIERVLNEKLKDQQSTPFPKVRFNGTAYVDDNDSASAVKNTAAGTSSRSKTPYAHFVLTDLHPNISSWKEAEKKSSHITYVSEPVDASNVSQALLSGHVAKDKKVFRLFNLAFHHFDDNLAQKVLQDTIETSDGFGIFELQSRDWKSLAACVLFGFIAWIFTLFLYWWNPLMLLFSFCIPIVPFVLFFDGVISALRTRTFSEVNHMFRACSKKRSRWELRTGTETFMWPVGRMTWIIGIKLDGDNDSPSDS
ncbi:hypothetical protein GGR57DRAFT_469960 [Xylariaceae sp. FL1272]|nr:hypothetical protein GGR57DRAFT_469960 [Xylariaceae sp. FL1272]